MLANKKTITGMARSYKCAALTVGMRIAFSIALPAHHTETA